MKRKFLLLMGIFSVGIMYAQIGINTEFLQSTLDVRAKVENTSIDGILPPRLSLADLSAKGNSLYDNKQQGAIIYITDISGGGNIGQRVEITNEGYYFFDGSLWQKLGISDGPSQDIIGDLKYSFQTADHDGWFLLNGKAVTDLPAGIQANAKGLGFSVNLPDATDRMLKMKTGTEILGESDGSNNLSIALENLPDVTLSSTITGYTLYGGSSHTHSFFGSSGSGGSLHIHTLSGTSDYGGSSHSHAFSGSSSESGGGAHTHSYSGTSSSAGSHSHAFRAPRWSESPSYMHRGNNTSSKWSLDSNTKSTTEAAGAHTHTFSATSSTSGAHSHSLSDYSDAQTHTHSLNSSYSDSSSHSHSYSGSSSADGGHTHTSFTTDLDQSKVSVGGQGAVLDKRSAYLSLNVFVFLGQ